MDNRLPGLDALRGIAAIVVVLFHLGLPIAGAHLAVDFFFMLSGFVMARTYDARLRGGSLGGWRFFFKRYRRLWGWMALGSATGLLAAWGEYGFSANLALAFALTLAMVPAVNLPSAPYLLNLPLWSIVYELVANAAHGLGLARAGNRTLATLAALCLLGLGWAIAAVGFPRGGFVEYHWWVLPRVGAAYVMGMVVWRLWGDEPPLRVPFAFAALALPAYVAVVWLWPWDYAPLGFIALLAPLMLFGGIGARFTRPDALRLATLLGAMSFPLYAVHYPAIRLLQLSWGPAALAGIGLAVWLWHRWRLPQSIISRIPKARPVPARNIVQLQ